ncbi:mycofactocin dehydrogenase MftG [Rhodococcus qingshengii]|uniref:mycofactocin dehydrogenase MftG n=1 Tax=Rhodococcus qingshengii TaxID=334542 RepID=UPI0021BB57D8|nr:mycofactocin system GMC family oxidoreductase MftG [Rhodococcus qingshengii]UXF67274.1 mycofactocin system GMC family oxidoreductase MftG [Rhodococcus qingshengii]
MEYDVIVVGSGSTGSVLAARLSEDENRSVLLVEAGEMYEQLSQMPEDILDPSNMSTSMPGNKSSWSVPGTLIPGVSVPVPRGKGMGGSSSINGSYWERAPRSNFDDWVGLGNDEWSYEKVLPHYIRSEHDHDFDGELHGKSGPIHVHRETPDRAPEFTSAFTEACTKMGFREDPDKNADGQGGVGPVPLNVWDGKRQNSGLAYLLPAMSRPNLHVVGKALARRVLFEGTRCIGVEVDISGEVKTYRGKEVVLSTGALRSPQLLMLSGVGPAAHLREHGIEVVQNLPGVGQNLTDHPELSVKWEFDGKCTQSPGRGVLTSALNWTAENSSQPDDLEILPFVISSGDMMRVTTMAKNPKQALSALRKTSTKFMVDQALNLRRPFTIVGLQQEDSRGTVELDSADPTKLPKINWNLMAEESDRIRFREGIRTVSELYNSDAMRAIGGKMTNLDKKDLADDKSIDNWARNHIFAVGHPSCTCRMGSDPDNGAVVDQFGRVHGVQGLRVADTSIFPKITSRGPNATAVMVGERLVEFFD